MEKTFTISTTETTFEIKINGQTLTVDFAAMHPTWVAAHLRKAAQRYLNDKYSGESGQTKFDLIRADLAEMHAGKEMPAAVRRVRAPDDPVLALALKNAKTTLVAVFKSRGMGAKVTEFAVHAVAGKYFKDDVWNDEAVIAWMDGKPGGVDYRAEAERALAVEL